jgi:hypothetical protein
MTENRKQTLMKLVVDAESLLSDYESKLLLEENPKEKRKFQKVITELQNTVKKYQAELNQLTTAVTDSISIIDFVNRQIELDSLRPDRLKSYLSPYALVVAPSGFGKSYFLEKLMSIYQEVEGKWTCRKVDFSHFDPDAHIECFYQSVTGQKYDGREEDAIETLCTYIVNEMTEPKSAEAGAERRAVLIIFDAIEKLNPNMRMWYYQLLTQIRNSTHTDQAETLSVRFIFAGRELETFWGGYRKFQPIIPAPMRIKLSPFEENHIEEYIGMKAKEKSITLSSAIIQNISLEIRFLSGGHPEAIRNFGDYLQGKLFAIGLVAKHFHDHKEFLVRKCISPITRTVYRELDDKMVDVVKKLSVFRYINMITVATLIVEKEFPFDTNPGEVLGFMQQHCLLDGPAIENPFYHDHLTRRILALDLAFGSAENSQTFFNLNRIAINLYSNWIQTLSQTLTNSPLAPIQQLRSMVEWIYHAIQDLTLDDKGFFECLQKLLHHFRQPDNPTNGLETETFYFNIFKETIEADFELVYLIHHRLGVNGVDAILTCLGTSMGLQE